MEFARGVFLKKLSRTGVDDAVRTRRHRFERGDHADSVRGGEARPRAPQRTSATPTTRRCGRT